jgi:transcriptional regulator with XRE-family HTH domain
MPKQSDYVKQLSELYQTYTGKELEEVLGVTTRSIQNYIKEDEPTIPRPEVIEKIREAYANHSTGNGLYNIKKEPQNATPSQVLLEESIYNLTATQKINAMSIDRLVNILSQVFNSTQPLTAPLGPVAEDTVKASQGPQGDLALGKKYGKKNKEGTHQR